MDVVEMHGNFFFVHKGLQVNVGLVGSQLRRDLSQPTLPRLPPSLLTYRNMGGGHGKLGRLGIPGDSSPTVT